MDTFYTNERNAQILIYLMKQHGVKKIVASPGTTNIAFVASVQQDDFFEVYSAADERSAGYLACGLAEESGEAVALSCTGATAARNYLPALTEAFYRKLPILAIAATQAVATIGHRIPQVIDNTVLANDVAKLRVQLPAIKDAMDEWACEIKANEALLALKHHGAGPVHVNLETTYSDDFSVRVLPVARVIERVLPEHALPELPAGKIGIFVGAHSKWSAALTKAVDAFCAKYNAVVLCDHTSNYKGAYQVLAPLAAKQEFYTSDCSKFDLLVDIGNVSGGYMEIFAKEVWRVNPDGAMCDPFKTLRYIFELSEQSFFERYANAPVAPFVGCSIAAQCQAEYKRILKKIPALPFSNVWVAQQTAAHLPKGSVLHLGILNSLRAWNFFELDPSILVYANTGGFGIDGCVSSLIGASLASPEKLFFGVVGDLAFFYDMNAMGNRHLGNNLRLMVVNNAKGAEFRNYNHKAAKFGNDADAYIAAAGHYGNASPQLLKHYAEDLGCRYLCASNKEEYHKVLPQFVTPENENSPMVLEVFTNAADESEALRLVLGCEKDGAGFAKGIVKSAAKTMLGDKKIQAIKNFVK